MTDTVEVNQCVHNGVAHDWQPIPNPAIPMLKWRCAACHLTNLEDADQITVSVPLTPAS